jgi:hypothetical protein
MFFIYLTMIPLPLELLSHSQTLDLQSGIVLLLSLKFCSLGALLHLLVPLVKQFLGTFFCLHLSIAFQQGLGRIILLGSTEMQQILSHAEMSCGASTLVILKSLYSTCRSIKLITRPLGKPGQRRWNPAVSNQILLVSGHCYVSFLENAHFNPPINLLILLLGARYLPNRLPLQTSLIANLHQSGPINRIPKLVE